jgi:hypothetical protein
MACGFVKVAVEGWACLIFKFVSLSLALDRMVNSPIKVGSLHVAQTFWLTTAEQYHIRRDKGIDVQTDDISDAYPPPWSFVKSLVGQDLCPVVVERLVGSVAFLTGQLGLYRDIKKLTKSS